MVNHHSVSIQHRPFRVLRNLKRNDVSPSPTAIASSVATIGAALDNAALAKQPLADVVRKLRSSEHHIVLQAIKELRMRGALFDGTLAWICLRYANLQRVDLSVSNLKNADLHKANLEDTDLSHANLNGARLTRAKLQLVNLDKTSLDGASLVGANLEGAKNWSNEQLAQVSRMRGSILPDGTLYDGRFNLPGDLADATILHVDLNTHAAIATFYGVSLDAFLRAQEWYQTHMPRTSNWHGNVCFQNAEILINRP